MSQVTLEEARLDHRDDILALTQDENLYGGMDYLPSALSNWLMEAVSQGSKRRNFVFFLDGKIMGFMSVYFFKNWTSCIKFAFRVSRLNKKNIIFKFKSKFFQEYQR